MTFNTDLAERVLAQIKDHPETWDQRDFCGQNDCGTTYCFAGWACVLEGEQFQVGSWNDLTTGEVASQRAAELLGLKNGGARMDALFFGPDGNGGSNDPDRVGHLVKHYANNPDDDSLPGDLS